MSRLIEADVGFVAVDNPNATKLMIHVLSAFAEHERNLIAERTKSALAEAMERGVTLGNPKINEARKLAIAANRKRTATFAANVGPIIAQLRASGLHTLREIARVLEAIGVRTATGGPWHAATVRNVEERFLQVQHEPSSQPDAKISLIKKAVELRCRSRLAAYFGAR